MKSEAFKRRLGYNVVLGRPTFNIYLSPVVKEKAKHDCNFAKKTEKFNISVEIPVYKGFSVFAEALSSNAKRDTKGKYNFSKKTDLRNSCKYAEVPNSPGLRFLTKKLTESAAFRKQTLVC